jgi:hypothetical protein
LPALKKVRRRLIYINSVSVSRPRIEGKAAKSRDRGAVSAGRKLIDGTRRFARSFPGAVGPA